jgi:hypothetical protein
VNSWSDCGTCPRGTFRQDELCGSGGMSSVCQPVGGDWVGEADEMAVWKGKCGFRGKIGMADS